MNPSQYFPNPKICVVLYCFRAPRKGEHFCNDCWKWATEEERAGYQFAHRAPFFGRYNSQMRHPECSASLNDMPAKVDRRWGTISVFVDGEERWLPDVLNEYERRSTTLAIAASVYARRKSGTPPWIAAAEAAMEEKGPEA